MTYADLKEMQKPKDKYEGWNIEDIVWDINNGQMQSPPKSK